MGMGEVSFKQESVFAVADEIQGLIRDHHEEVSYIPDLKLDPNFDHYYKIEANHSLRVFTARKSGQLVGYAVYIVMGSTYHKTLIEATQQLIFISKKHRGFGSAFLKWMTQRLENEGVDLIYAHLSMAGKPAAALYLSQGFELSDVVYLKRVGVGNGI